MGLEIGRLHVRRSILIQASPGRVWQEFESFERIAAWLNLGHTLHVFEPTVGGKVAMSVEIDGVARGETPLGKLQLEAGRHRLVLTNDNVIGVIRDVIEIESGAIILRRYSFDDVGYLKVVATPWADVSVDGRPIGQTPMSRVRVTAGAHSVRFSHPEYGSFDREVEIGSGQTTLLRIELAR